MRTLSSLKADGPHALKVAAGAMTKEIVMSTELRRRVSSDPTAGAQPPVVPITALVQLEHLLKVTGSIAQDANQTWAEIWSELKKLTTGGGLVTPEAAQGFVPACGWPEFLEKFWLLKHYLDSIQRMCERKN